MASTAFNQSNRMIFLWLAIPLITAIFLFTGPISNGATQWADVLEILGIFAVFICIIGRCWSILFIGSNKNQSLTQRGPYHFTRNPLYFFSTIGAFGVGLMAESLVLAVCAGFFSYVVFRYVIAREEKYLGEKFGAEYKRFVAQVPRFWPNPIALLTAKPSDEPVTFSPRALRRTFVDACTFVLLFPVMEALDWLHASGTITPLVHLY